MIMATIRPTNNHNNTSGTSNKGTDDLLDTQSSSNHSTNNSSTIKPSLHNNQNTSSTVKPKNNSNLDKTGKTIRPETKKGHDESNTVRPHTNNNANQSSKSSTDPTIDATLYQQRKFYKIKGEEYRVIKSLSLTNGQAQVFLVESPSEQKYVLKLYFEEDIPSSNILDKVKNCNGTKVFFHLCDHGKFEDRYYELMHYYDGDTLEHTDVRKNLKAIIPLIRDMAISIDFCHQLGFIHRDIKPENFIFESKGSNHILLGDFGIAVECDENGECNADMSRTKIYAAPEVYLNTGDGIARFSTKSDFYSLGMVIIFLWQGREEFTHFEKENELQLATLKNYGTFPIPHDMPVKLKSLVGALLEPNPSVRAGFKEIENWLNDDPLKEGTEASRDEQNKSPFTVVFNGEKNLVAHSPEELARFMYDDKILSEDYLYRKKVQGWLDDNNRPELAIEMEKITEDKYPHNQRAGLLAACYILDPSIPFDDINHEPCRKSSEIANSILSHFDTYLAQLSQSLDNSLTVFLRTHGLESAFNDFKKEFEKNRRLGLLYLAYRLDANQPWQIIDNHGQSFCFNHEDEILNWVSDHNYSNMSASDLVSKAFQLWVSHRNTITAAAINPLMKYQGNMDYAEGVLYRLNPKVGLFFVLDEKSEDYILSLEQIGRWINENLVTSINLAPQKDKKSDNNLNNVKLISQGKLTSLYHFLSSKGKEYEKWIDIIKYDLDFNSDDNKKKAGPYNYYIAMFKIIKGMGEKAFYTFKSGKTIDDPSQLSDVPKADINDALERTGEPLISWISVFFQEDPFLDKKEKYAFEKRTVDFMNFLISQKFITENVKQYVEAKQSVQSLASKLQKLLSFVKTSRFIVAFISLLPICIIGILLIYKWELHSNDFDYNTIVFTIFIIMTILGLITGIGDDNIVGGIALVGCFGTIIASLIICGICYYLPFIIPYIAGICVFMIGYSIYKSTIGHSVLKKNAIKLLNPDFEHLELEPLHEAYHPNVNGFDSSIYDDSKTYQNELTTLRNRMWSIAIPIGVIAIICLAAYKNPNNKVWSYIKKNTVERLINKDEQTDQEQIQVTNEPSEIPDFSNGLYGTWYGTFQGTETRIKFQKTSNPKEFDMILGDHIFSGVFDYNKKRFSFNKYKDLGSGLSITNTKKNSKNISGSLQLKEDKLYGKVKVKQLGSYEIDIQFTPY